MSNVGRISENWEKFDAERKLKFTKVKRGHYATPDGRYAVVQDGYDRIQSVGAEGSKDGGRGSYEGFPGGEWAAVHHPPGGLRDDANAGDNLDWFSTKKEAVEHAEGHARAQAQKAETHAKIHEVLNHFDAADKALAKSDYSGRTKEWSEGWKKLRMVDPVFDRENRDAEKAQKDYDAIVDEMRRAEVIEPKDFEGQFDQVRAMMPGHAKRLDAAAAQIAKTRPNKDAALRRVRGKVGR